MVKDNTVSTLLDDNTYKKFREYLIDKENDTQERYSVSAVARELIEYALEHMNGKRDTEQPEQALIEQEVKQDANQNKFSDLKF